MSSLKTISTFLAAVLFLLPGNAGAQSSSACAALTYNLYFGLTDAATGGEVSRLQSRLGGQVTGYFGPLTERLVQQWQAANGVVSSGSPDTTGYGAVGPRSRALLATSCGNSQTTLPTSISPVTLVASSSSAGLVAEFVASSAEVVDEVSGTDYAQYEIAFELTADDTDAYVSMKRFTEDATLAVVAQNSGLNYDLTGGALSFGNMSLVSSAPAASGNSSVFHIREGETEEFTLYAVSTTTVGKLKIGAIQFGTSLADFIGCTLYVDENEFDTPTLGDNLNVPPTCKIGYTRPADTIYVGDRVNVKWSSENATNLRWVRDTSGKDSQTPPTGTPKLSGSSYITIDVAGQAEIELEATGPGGTSNCSLTLATEIRETFPSVTINESSLEAYTNGPTTITGRAEDVSKLYVYQVGSAYTGGLDYASIVEANKGDGAPSQTAIIAYPNPSEVRNGKWSAYFGGWPQAGTYTVIVFDAVSKERLATEKLVVKEAIAKASVTIPKNTYTTKNPILTGTAKNVESFTIILPDLGKYADVVFVKNGKWSHTVLPELANGTYRVEAQDPKGNVLGTGTFRVNVEEPVVETDELVGVKAIGVYEGTYSANNPRVFQGNVEGTVTVNVTGDTGMNRDLVLTSYEPVNWVLNVQSGVKIGKIIVTGYNTSRVTNVPAGTDVEVYSYAQGGKYYYAYQASGDSFVKLKNWLTGLYPASDGVQLYGDFTFPGYSASSVDVYIGYKG